MTSIFVKDIDNVSKMVTGASFNLFALCRRNSYCPFFDAISSTVCWYVALLQLDLLLHSVSKLWSGRFGSNEELKYILSWSRRFQHSNV
ncbi:hypothetical protein vseg_011062 [Gypsophila vaccaria]